VRDSMKRPRLAARDTFIEAEPDVDRAPAQLRAPAANLDRVVAGHDFSRIRVYPAELGLKSDEPEEEPLQAQAAEVAEESAGPESSVAAEESGQSAESGTVEPLPSEEVVHAAVELEEDRVAPDQAVDSDDSSPGRLGVRARLSVESSADHSQPTNGLRRLDAVKGPLSFGSSVTQGGVTVDVKAFGSEAANYSVDSITYKVGKSAVDVTGRIVLDCNWDTDARGRSDVPSASAAAVTSTTWKDVAGDLEPNAGGVPKRKKYWAPDLTSKHEKYHASDDIGRATLYRPTAEVWPNTQTVDPAKAKAEVAALMDKARGYGQGRRLGLVQRRGRGPGLRRRKVVLRGAGEGRQRPRDHRGMEVMPPDARSPEDEGRREASSRGLQGLGFATDAGGLARALADESLGIRAEAAFLLGFLPGRASLDPLRRALSDESARVRVEAALALARQGEVERALPVLRAELLGAFFADAPLRAARALALLGDPRGYSRVLEALRSELPSNRMEAIAAIPSFLRYVGQALDGAPMDPVAELVRAAQDPEEILRRDALSALAATGDSRAIPVLEAAQSDPSQAVRELALRLLAALPSTSL
jgi:HEAT repeats